MVHRLWMIHWYFRWHLLMDIFCVSFQIISSRKGLATVRTLRHLFISVSYWEMNLFKIFCYLYFSSSSIPPDPHPHSHSFFLLLLLLLPLNLILTPPPIITIDPHSHSIPSSSRCINKTLLLYKYIYCLTIMP